MRIRASFPPHRLLFGVRQSFHILAHLFERFPPVFAVAILHLTDKLVDLRDPWVGIEIARGPSDAKARQQ